MASTATANKRVVSAAAREIGAVIGAALVGSGTSNKAIRSVTTSNEFIITNPAKQGVGAVPTRQALSRSIASPTVQQVITAATDQRIAAAANQDSVIAGSAIQDIR